MIAQGAKKAEAKKGKASRRADHRAGGVATARQGMADGRRALSLKHYHQRSNVESTFGAIKAKFGGSVRSKTFVAQQNEVLAKVLLWNLTCIIQAIEELGVEAEFSRLVMP